MDLDGGKVLTARVDGDCSGTMSTTTTMTGTGAGTMMTNTEIATTTVVEVTSPIALSPTLATTAPPAVTPSQKTQVGVSPPTTGFAVEDQEHEQPRKIQKREATLKAVNQDTVFDFKIPPLVSSFRLSSDPPTYEDQATEFAAHATTAPPAAALSQKTPVGVSPPTRGNAVAVDSNPGQLITAPTAISPAQTTPVGVSPLTFASPSSMEIASAIDSTPGNAITAPTAVTPSQKIQVGVDPLTYAVIDPIPVRVSPPTAANASYKTPALAADAAANGKKKNS